MPKTTSQTVLGYPLTAGWRLALGLGCLFLLAGFALAAGLEPDPRGYGTHQQLGLPECSVMFLYGVPCPACGGTTAFALFVRGRWPEAVRANLSAFVMACLAALAIPWSLFSTAIGRAWRVDRPDLLLIWILGSCGTVSFLQWLLVLAWGRFSSLS